VPCGMDRARGQTNAGSGKGEYQFAIFPPPWTRQPKAFISSLVVMDTVDVLRATHKSREGVDFNALCLPLSTKVLVEQIVNPTLLFLAFLEPPSLPPQSRLSS